LEKEKGKEPPAEGGEALGGTSGLKPPVDQRNHNQRMGEE